MIANILFVVGGIFYLLGGLGVLRMPDTFNRIQAGTKATTLGSFSILIGIIISHPEWTLKAILILVLIALTNPIGSSSLAKATYVSNTLPNDLVVDEMTEVFKEEQ